MLAHQLLGFARVVRANGVHQQVIFAVGVVSRPDPGGEYLLHAGVEIHAHRARLIST